jgi:adenylyltransferase/sulfurtransferase
MAAGVLVADVRELDELPAVDEFVHVKIPLSGITDKWPEAASDTIIVFCQTGKRSLQAARLLNDRFGGSKKVYSLAGGILQWKKEQPLQK